MRNDNTRFELKTDLHQSWLNQLKDFYAVERYIPTYEFMGSAFKIGSKSLVSKFVKLLLEGGFLDYGSDRRLKPGRRFFEIPITYESVQAGPNTDSFVEGGEYIALTDLMIRKPSITRVAPIRGNSMKNLGILDGDWAVYELHPFAHAGQLVVASLNNQNALTVKELGKEGNTHVLIPHNENFEIMRPKEGFHVRGIVMGICRRYEGGYFNAMVT